MHAVSLLARHLVWGANGASPFLVWVAIALGTLSVNKLVPLVSPSTAEIDATVHIQVYRIGLDIKHLLITNHKEMHFKQSFVYAATYHLFKRKEIF